MNKIFLILVSISNSEAIMHEIGKQQHAAPKIHNSLVFKFPISRNSVMSQSKESP